MMKVWWCRWLYARTHFVTREGNLIESSQKTTSLVMRSREIEHVDDRRVFASSDRIQWQVRPLPDLKLPDEMMTLVTDAVPYAYEAAARSPYDGYRHHLHHHHHHHHHPHPHRYRRVYAPTESEYLQEGYISARADTDNHARLINNNVPASTGSLNYRNDRVRWALSLSGPRFRIAFDWMLITKWEEE